MIQNCSNRLIRILILTLCFVICSASVLADGASPYADVIFKNATVSISSSGSVTFMCTTKKMVGVIEVTSCTVYKKNANNSWSSVSDALSVPTTKSYNSIGYTQTVTPSKAFSDGTYKVTATFSADGHTKTVTSAERSFN